MLLPPCVEDTGHATVWLGANRVKTYHVPRLPLLLPRCSNISGRWCAPNMEVDKRSWLCDMWTRCWGRINYRSLPFSRLHRECCFCGRIRDTLSRYDKLVPPQASICCLTELGRTNARQGQHKNDRILRGRPITKRYSKLHGVPPLVRSVIPLPLNGACIAQTIMDPHEHERSRQDAKHVARTQRSPLSRPRFLPRSSSGQLVLPVVKEEETKPETVASASIGSREWSPVMDRIYADHENADENRPT